MALESWGPLVAAGTFAVIAASAYAALAQATRVH
jgi:hypothetical protein